MDSKRNKLNNSSAFLSSLSTTMKPGNDACSRQYNQFHLKKRKVQPYIPYDKIEAIV